MYEASTGVRLAYEGPPARGEPRHSEEESDEPRHKSEPDDAGLRRVIGETMEIAGLG
jgi:hypothetical protein